MNEEDLVEEEMVLPTDTEQTIEEVEETSEVVEQDPLKTELEKVQRKGRTKAEKLLFTKKRVEEQLRELGIEDEPLEDDERPVTIADLKRFQAESATKTALQLADEVNNEAERELIKHNLENVIRSTGDPKQDFELARTLVNAVKNRQITEETTRKPIAKTHPTGSSAPAKVTKPQDDLTPQEKLFMSAPFNMTKEAIIAARPKE